MDSTAGATTGETESTDSTRSTPWTASVLDLLGDWRKRASVSAETHYSHATRLSRYNVRFGVPVVAFTTFVGTSVFATLEHQLALGLRLTVGMVSVLAAVLASLQTFLRFGERAEKHRVAAEHWAAIRREIDEMLALHPTYLASRGDPKDFLDGLRARMDEVSQRSPEMGELGFWRVQRRYAVDHDRAAPGGKIRGTAGGSAQARHG